MASLVSLSDELFSDRREVDTPTGSHGVNTPVTSRELDTPSGTDTPEARVGDGDPLSSAVWRDGFAKR